MSCVFAFWGSGSLALILILSTVTNYFLGLGLPKGHEFKKAWLLLGIVFNLAILIYFKYVNFFISEFSKLLTYHGQPVNLFDTVLPIGLSFFTFQSISYLVDIFRGQIPPSREVLKFSHYMLFFPKLVSGPITRSSQFVNEAYLQDSLTYLNRGIWRFSIGLAKKVILADQLGKVVDTVFSLPDSELTAVIAWIGIGLYTLQIYLDFSAYSDMAIGLSQMFGYTLPENFQQPYRASSVSEFWRLWHMTLSFWFRDYVYIPLGGSRKGTLRTISNLLVVFVLCGLWHGANWTFVVWGLYHAIILICEHILKKFKICSLPHWVNQILTFLVVTLGWVFFRSESVSIACHYLATLFGLSYIDSSHIYFPAEYFMQSNTVVFTLIGCIVAFYPARHFDKISEIQSPKLANLFFITKSLLSVALMLLSIIFLSKSTFHPFIYAQF